MKKLILGLVMAFAITACSNQAAPTAKASACPCCEQVDANGKLSAGGKQCCLGMKGGKMSTGTPCPCCSAEGKMCDKSGDKKAAEAKPVAKAKAAPAKAAAAPATKAEEKKAPATEAKDAKPAEKK